MNAGISAKQRDSISKLSGGVFSLYFNRYKSLSKQLKLGLGVPITNKSVTLTTSMEKFCSVEFDTIYS